MRQPSGHSSVACDVLSVQSVQNRAEPVHDGQGRPPLESENPSPRSGEKIIPTGRRKFFSASRAKHFFIRQPKKSPGQAGQNIPLKNRRKNLPDKQGKSFLKQKSLSLNRKTSPCTEKPLLEQKNLSLHRKIVSCRRDAKTPALAAGVFAVCLLGERENHIRNGSFVRVR